MEGACAVYDGPAPRLPADGARGWSRPTDACFRNACPIQSEFPAYAALPPQPFDLDAFEETEQACLEEAGLRVVRTEDRAAGYETTIAMALAGDRRT